MRFRKYLFMGLMLLSLLWIGMSVSSVQRANEKAQAANDSVAGQIGSSIGSGLAYNCTVMPGVFLALIFAALAYRNHVGLKKRKASESEPPDSPLDPHLE